MAVLAPLAASAGAVAASSGFQLAMAGVSAVGQMAAGAAQRRQYELSLIHISEPTRPY